MDHNRIAELFWSKVAVVHRSRCWNWKGAINSDGYGNFQINRVTHKAHRVAFLLRNGKWPSYACHKCDNPTCVNPDHIYDGTHAKNMQEAYLGTLKKGRPSGAQCWNTKLTDQIVIRMRELYKSGDRSIPQIAALVGCSKDAAQRAIARESFKHLP